jgi:hypothetical protein
LLRAHRNRRCSGLGGEVFAAPIQHPSAWTVADFRSPADYSVDLDAAQLRDIAAAMRRIKAAGIGLDGLQREHFEVPSLRPVVEEIRRQVEDGRGFVLLRRLPIEDYSKDDLGLIFWGIGTHLGRGLSQSVMGDRLGHVKDFSREDPGARAYRNKQELSPHTDSCDLVGLLCLRNAQVGGGRLGLGQEAVKALNPRAIYASVKGFGSGIERMRERTGFGILVALLQFGILSDDLTGRNMDIFAAEVMPHLRD